MSNLSLNIPTIIVSIVCIVMYIMYVFTISTNIGAYNTGSSFNYAILRQLILIMSIILNIISAIMNIKNGDSSMLVANTIFLIILCIIFYFVNIK